MHIPFQATYETDQAELEELAKGGDVYEDWKYERFPNLLDVIDQFHSLKIDATLLLHHLPLLQCVSVYMCFLFGFKPLLLVTIAILLHQLLPIHVP